MRYVNRPQERRSTSALDSSARGLSTPDLLAMLWPEPCVVDWTPRSRHATTSVAYTAVPNWKSPAIITPRRPRRLMASLLRGYNTAGRGNTRILAQLAALGASVGLTDHAFHDVWIDDSAAGPQSSITKHLSAVLGYPVALSVSIGPLRAVQKPVIQVSDPHRKTVAFAKIGHTDLTRELVRREAENLTQIAKLLSTHVELEVPTVLEAGPWRNAQVLVQTALPRGHAPRHRQFVQAMRIIAHANGAFDSHIKTSQYWARLRKRIGAVAKSDATNLLQASVAAVDRSSHNPILSFGSWHGDMSPWNITADARSVRIWDWEHYQHGVPVGFDVLHYGLQNRVSRNGEDLAHSVLSTATETRCDLADLGVSPEAAPWTALLYLLEIATRYVEDGEVGLGTKLGSLGWFEPALLQRITRSCGLSW